MDKETCIGLLKGKFAAYIAALESDDDSDAAHDAIAAAHEELTDYVEITGENWEGGWE